MKLVNNIGMSLVELLVAVGLLGGVSLATMSLMTSSQKSNSDFEKSVDVLNLEKTIAAYLLSDHGCTQVATLGVGSPFKIRRYERSFDKTKGKFETKYKGVLYEEGKQIGKVLIESMKISNITELTLEKDSAIVTVSLSFLTKTGSDQKRFIKQIQIPVGLKDGVVSDCKLDRKVLYEFIEEKVCSDTFGIETFGMTCAEAIAYVEEKAKQSICYDLTGGLEAYDGSTGLCNLLLAHKDKYCPEGQSLRGFDSFGGLICD